MYTEGHEGLQKKGTPQDKQAHRAWLERADKDLDHDYQIWTHEPHLAGKTGLSRYYDFGDGPPQEAVKDETGFYRKVAQYFFFDAGQADSYVYEKRPEAKDSVAGEAYSRDVCAVPRTR